MLDSLRTRYEQQIAEGGSPTVIGILTGGASTRMGRDKATTPVGGTTMAQRVAAAAHTTGLEAVVLGPDDAGTGLESIADLDDAPAGPLGGLISVLRARPGHAALLIAADQPFVRPETMLHLVVHGGGDVVVPIEADLPQVTCAWYGPAVLNAYDKRNSGDVWRLRSLLDLVRTASVFPEEWRAWGEDGRSFRSLDRPEDIATALVDFGED